MHIINEPETILNTAPQPSKRTRQDFAKAYEGMIAANDKGYKGFPGLDNPVYPDYTLEDIKQILATGNLRDMQQLSAFCYRYSGVYKQLINYYTSLLTYDLVVAPNFKTTIPKNKAISRVNQVLDFVKAFNVKVSCPHIVHKIFMEGAYYGLLRVSSDSVVLQDLPLQYCRTRFKNKFGINIIEFDLRFFDTLSQRQDELMKTLQSFPDEILQALLDYKNGGASSWFFIPSDLGVCFYYEDLVPYFLSTTPAIYHYDDSQEREVERDKEELQKILINKMPLSKQNDEPVFELEEMLEMHQGMVGMLANNKYIDVITSFGEITLEQAQDVSGQAQRDSLGKFKKTVFDEAGTSSELFNAQGNTALSRAIEKDTGLMMLIANLLADWLSFQINFRFSDAKIDFTASFLPITQFNKKEMAAIYLAGANSGYSKIYAGIAHGVDQSNLSNMIKYENDILDLDINMVPLQSAYTASNTGEKNSTSKAQKGVKSASTGDTTTGGGRPSSSEDDQADQTIANKNSGA